MSIEPTTTSTGAPSTKIAVPSSTAAVRSGVNKVASEFVPSILDKEVSKGNLDAFGHRHFAEALRGLIEAPEHQPPYSIGLLGGWGTGKSSVKAMYLNDLADTTGPDARSTKVRSITFNAWRFGGEDIRRALLRDVFVQLGGNEATIHDQFFAQTSQILAQPKGLMEMAQESGQRLLWIFFQLLAIFAFSVLMVALVAWVFNIDSEQYYTWLVAAFLAVSAFAFKTLEKSVVNRYTDVTKIELPKASAEQYEKLLKDHLIAWKKKERSVERLVIFVDDLDRLSSEEMVDGLDAIRALMELPTGGAGVGVVFVISCDEDLVAEALSKRAKTAAELPGAISNRKVARRYLDRIFQFRLDIPPTPRLDMRSFAVQLLNRDCFKQIVERVDSSGSSVEEVVSRMIHVGVQNPRNAIQIVNAFAASMWIAMRREFEGSSSSRAGALIEGAVTGHPITLAVLSALKVNFPEFYQVLQTEPGALDGFIHIFIRGDNQSELPGSVSAALRPFATSAPDDSSPTWKISDDYLPLRQFISSVQFVRLPDSLQPLINLNQDEVSRRTGDAGSRLYNPTVSGDVPGVLRALGRDADERSLQRQEVESLFAVWELVETDSLDRKENAALVLAELVGRCHIDQARKLAVPIAPTVASSLGLRSRLGLAPLQKMLPLIRDLDRTALQLSLVSDFGLVGESPMLAMSPTGKAFALEDAIGHVQQVVVLLMEEWKSNRLALDIQRNLAAWMLERNVAVSEKSKKVLPFAVVDGWMTEYEALLIPALGIDYAFGVASELASKEPSLLDKDSARARLLKILEQERSNPRFWELLSQVTQLSDVESCLVAQRLGRNAIGDASPDQIASWAKILANRVQSYAGEELHNDDKDAVSLLTELSRSHSAALNKASDQIRDCIIALSEFESNAEHGVSLLQGLNSVSRPAWSEVAANWLERLASDLPAKCAQELGRNLEKTEAEPLLSARSSALRSCANNPNRAVVLDAYWTVAQDQAGISSYSMQTELSHLLQTMAAATSDFGSTEQFWSIFRIALHKATESVGDNLDTLLSQSKATPVSFISVMRFLEEEWNRLPELSPLTGGKVVAYALPVITGLTSGSNGAQLLKSLHKLISSTALSDDEMDQLASAVAPIWGSFAPEATELLASLADHFWKQELTLICDQWESDPHTLLPSFGHLLTAVIPNCSEDELAELLELVVARPAISAGGTNDSAVASLIDAIPPDVARRISLAYAFNREAPIELRRRVLRRIQGLTTGAERDWVANYIRAAAATQLDEIFRESVEFLNAMTNESERYNISIDLLRSFPSIESLDEKRKLLEAVFGLGGQAACETFCKSQSATLEDLTLASEQFPLSKKISNSLKKLRTSA